MYRGSSVLLGDLFLVSRAPMYGADPVRVVTFISPVFVPLLTWGRLPAVLTEGIVDVSARLSVVRFPFPALRVPLLALLPLPTASLRTLRGDGSAVPRTDTEPTRAVEALVLLLSEVVPSLGNLPGCPGNRVGLGTVLSELSDRRCKITPSRR